MQASLRTLRPGSLAVVVCATLAVTSLRADSIAFNFTRADGSETLAPTYVAGYGDVAQDNWNNLTMPNPDGNGNNSLAYNGTVMDDSGVLVSTGMTVNVSPDPQVWSFNASPWGFADATMHNGGLHGTFEITVTDIPYENYDVYAYVAAGDNGGTDLATISVANGVPGGVDPNGTYYYRFGWTAGTYAITNALTEGEANAGAFTNIVQFSGNTASDFTIAWDGRNSGAWTGIAGFQIVEIAPVPEPGTASLLLGAGLLLLRRRRA